MAGGDASGESPEAGAWERRGTGGEGESVSESQGGASFSEVVAVVRLRQGALPGSGEEQGPAGAAVRAGQLVDGGWSTGGVVRVATGQCRSQGRTKSPTARSRAKLKGLSAGRQDPDRSSHPLRRSVKHNPGQTALFRVSLAVFTPRGIYESVSLK